MNLRLRSWPLPLQWLALFALAALLALALQAARMPAALFLGPMLAAIVFGVGGTRVRVPQPAFIAGQAVIGAMIAQTVTASALAALAQTWPILLLAVLATVAVSAAVGAALTRWGGLPGSTAAWGTVPGAAGAMIAMAAAYDADARIVATMQYVRVVCVVLTASVVGRVVVGADLDTGPPAPGWPADAGQWSALAVTLGVIAVGVLVRPRRLPAAPLLLPVLLGVALQVGGVVGLRVPEPLLVAAYAALGGYVGLRFDAGLVRYVLRTLPWMLLASIVLIGLCALSGWGLTALLPVDDLTAYLATSPGGMDSIAIIALDAHVDIGPVLALQTLRLVGIVLLGPALARQVARLAPAASQGANSNVRNSCQGPPR